MALRMTWKEAAARGLVPSKPPSEPLAARTLKHLQRANTPEDRLVAAVTARYPGAVRNYRCLPPRRFTLDVAIPELKVAVECDGWAHHGRRLKDFHRDREKRNLLELGGWIVLAFSARDIQRDLPSLMDQVDQAVRLQLTSKPPIDPETGP